MSGLLLSLLLTLQSTLVHLRLGVLSELFQEKNNAAAEDAHLPPRDSCDVNRNDRWGGSAENKVNPLPRDFPRAPGRGRSRAPERIKEASERERKEQAEKERGSKKRGRSVHLESISVVVVVMAREVGAGRGRLERLIPPPTPPPPPPPHPPPPPPED